MTYKFFLIGVLSGLFFLDLAQLNKVSTPEEIAKILKKAESTEDIEDCLKKFGFSDSIVNNYKKFSYGDSIFNLFEKNKLVRVDVFKVNIDSQPDSEYVIQVIFKYGIQEMGWDGDGKEYFLIINKKIESGFKSVWEHIFHHDLCNFLEEGKTTFRFESIKNLRYAKILFTRNIIESCGIELAGYEKVDTLIFKEGKYIFIEGRPYNRYYYNRMDITE